MAETPLLSIVVGVPGRAPARAAESIGVGLQQLSKELLVLVGPSQGASNERARDDLIVRGVPRAHPLAAVLTTMGRRSTAAPAVGRYLLFTDAPGEIDPAWVTAALRAFETDEYRGISRYAPSGRSTFLIPAALWRSLRGYDRPFYPFPEWAEVDLDARVAALGYSVDWWPAQPKLTAPAPPPPELRSGDARFLARWGDGLMPASRSRARPAKSSIVVYTAITDGYDVLKEQPEPATEGVDFVAFVDERTRSTVPAQQSWQLRAIEAGSLEPRRAAKIYKILPHRYFPEKELSLWIDGSVHIEYPFATDRLVETFMQDVDLCAFRHSRRSCAYVEAERCRELERDDADVLLAQVDRYRREGLPENAGLIEATVLLRRHSPRMNAFDEAWWEEIERGSWRDQVSFPYLARKLGLRYKTFPLALDWNNGLFRRHPHVDGVARSARRT